MVDYPSPAGSLLPSRGRQETRRKVPPPWRGCKTSSREDSCSGHTPRGCLSGRYRDVSTTASATASAEKGNNGNPARKSPQTAPASTQNKDCAPRRSSGRSRKKLVFLPEGLEVQQE